MDDNKDSNVTDIKAEEGATQTVEQLPPTHQALPITLLTQILKYLRKQPMEDVEDLVGGIQMQAVPLALQQKQPPENAA